MRIFRPRLPVLSGIPQSHVKVVLENEVGIRSS
jgi:hypothetical protein